eukprot:5356870-Alexandrium_andersonii.AAC.1
MKVVRGLPSPTTPSTSKTRRFSPADFLSPTKLEAANPHPEKQPALSSCEQKVFDQLHTAGAQIHASSIRS